MSEQNTAPQFASFEEFWKFYLQEHGDTTNRRLHQIGTTMGLGVAACALVTRTPALIPLALVAGYGPAWVGHFFVEKNKPASFKHPLWSFRGDMRMNRMLWTGQLDRELERLGLKELSSSSR